MYETVDDLNREKDVADLMALSWNCTAHKLPIHYEVDFALTRCDNIKAWAEVKCRSRTYDVMYVSLHKWKAGKELSRVTGLPFLLVYGVNGKVYWTKADELQPTFCMGGRADRNDWQDREPMAAFALSSFKVM